MTSRTTGNIDPGQARRVINRMVAWNALCAVIAGILYLVTHFAS